MTLPLYPLRFEPAFRRYVWGGRRLGTELGKQIGPEGDYAECWELVDRGSDQVRVEQGPLQGVTLGELVKQYQRPLFGRHAPVVSFPLLIKLLDAHQNLSVQVHPNDTQAVSANPPDLGKTEAWIILAARPGSRIYAGLLPGIERGEFAEALAKGACVELLHSFVPSVGDCVFLPAGTVHALGAGLLVAEIQQSSDTTYRLYDWGRLGTDGRPRTLHIEDGLAAIDFPQSPVQPRRERREENAETLIECEKFCVVRRRINGPTKIGGDDRFHVLMVLEGSLTLSGDPCRQPLEYAQTALIPAELKDVLATPTEGAIFLDIYLP